MSTFLSLTVHCGRCHDHKFDPITMRDYYSLQAVFAGIDRADRPVDSDAEVASRRRALSRRLRELAEEKQVIDADVARLGGEELRALEQRIKAAKTAAKPDAGAFGYHSEISTTPDTVKWVQVDLGEPRAIDRVVYVGCHDDFNNIGAGFGFPPRYRLELSDDPEFRSGVTMLVDHTKADVPNPGVKPQSVSAQGKRGRYVRVTATQLALRQNDYIFALAELLVLDAAGQNRAHGAPVTALDSIEAPVRWQKKNLVDGYYVGAGRKPESDQQVVELTAQREALLQRVLPVSVREHGLANEAATRAVKEQLDRLPQPQIVYGAANDFAPQGSFAPPKGIRPVHLLKRGEVKRPGDLMAPGALAGWPGLDHPFACADPSAEGNRRAALARWITDPRNLMARRSIVNRVWQYHFGRGLVDTPNDFGRMGSAPTHPELLDWLAFWFLDHGESLKALHRLIVTSATYRQSSGMRNQNSGPTAVSRLQSTIRNPHSIDADNRFLWRMNRARLEAECIRDALLAASGKLDLSMGGPSVQQFYFKDDHSPLYDYTRYDADSPGSHRRSIYRFLVRSVTDPFMDTLDCPDPSVLTPKRNTTLTALQALAVLNNPFILRQAEHLAERVRRMAADAAGQIAAAYQLALSRPPTADESAKLVAHAQQHGLANACRVILNSSEFMFVD